PWVSRLADFPPQRAFLPGTRQPSGSHSALHSATPTSRQPPPRCFSPLFPLRSARPTSRLRIPPHPLHLDYRSEPFRPRDLVPQIQNCSIAAPPQPVFVHRAI